MRTSPLMVLMMATAATAAPEPPLPEAVQTIEDALAEPGFVVFDVSAPKQCAAGADGWGSDKVAGALKVTQGRAVQVPRTRGSVDRLVGEGLAAGVVRYAFKDGVEVDRVCGCLPADAMATWLVQAAAGTTMADARRAELQAFIDSSTTQPWPASGYLEVVQLDACAGRLDDAFATARKIWDTIPELAPEERDLRLTRVARDMGALGLKHPPAEAEITAMRDALDAPKDSDTAALDDWVVLNRLLRQDDVTFAWFDAHKDDADKAELIQRLAPNVFYMKTEQGKWAEAGTIIGDVGDWLSVWKRQVGGLDSAVRGYAALMAADRGKEAIKLAKDVVKGIDASAACQMIAKTTEVGVTASAEKPIAKQCEDAAIVAAWEATL